jgi:hypothetical protein
VVVLITASMPAYTVNYAKKKAFAAINALVHRLQNAASAINATITVQASRKKSVQHALSHLMCATVVLNEINALSRKPFMILRQLI